ncbi:hypothetical protein CI102_12194 [Trichoderma harzianum]|uniref:Uncharacterized protein n=1 Tax=Trichoderma harzianum CBS 226.95 TaxID=983964 RepID=A0A2T4A3R3_TRIHA|nr:hypothetical protein M431DRAFT_92299 [Trichoderma harzianum CBS 226.95]PKK43124.1 hypothetical protein CI102_12194 [Trichoderma harzianum]PTB51715.1 hypothetical protein M431DRAFT_92299 [Trichoderma harzianum CBS 226.95]
MPKKSYKHKPSRNGNLLFAKLPAEIRYEIWCMLFSIECKGPVMPVHIPRDNATETFFSLRRSDQDSIFVLNALMKTCRLFYQDQEYWMLFYKFNEFQFPRSRDCLTYVAAITPSRRNAIQHITLTLPTPYNRNGVKKGKPGNRLRAIAKLCPNLRVLRHEKFFYRSDSLTNWLTLLAETMEPIVASLPLLKEVHIRGSNDGHTWLTCRMTLQKIDLILSRSTAQGPVHIRDSGEQVLTAVWEILSKRRTVDERPLEPRLVKQAIRTTPILTLGQDRRQRSRVNGVRQNVRRFARGTVPDFIFGGTGTVKDIRFPRDEMCPELLIGTVWYHWDAIFSSNRLSEYHSKSYVSEAAYRFRKKYVSWVYFSGTSKGRRHGNRSPQSKLINCIWQLNWQDNARKLDILGDLYVARNDRRRRRY